jgi:TnpA family transposase
VAEYRDCLFQPAGRIDHKLIASEKANIDRVVATLGLKEMSQSILVRKLCTLSSHHPTRKAIFEFDKLVRSIYTLRYLRDPQLFEICYRRADLPHLPHRGYPAKWYHAKASAA